MQGSIGVDAAGTVYELTGDYATGHLPTYLANAIQLTVGTHGEFMPWMCVTADGRVDTIFYDYDESNGLMDGDYGQVAAGGSTLSRTVVQRAIDGAAQQPRGPGHTPFMG